MEELVPVRWVLAQGKGREGRGGEGRGGEGRGGEGRGGEGRGGEGRGREGKGRGRQGKEEHPPPAPSSLDPFLHSVLARRRPGSEVLAIGNHGV